MSIEFDVNGVSAYAYTGGRPLAASLRSVVFIHGAAHDHSVWALQSRYFAWHDMNAIAFDLPGHGRSSGEPLASVEALADWVDAALTALGIGPAVLVGHSMGSLAALETASRYPQRAEKLVLVGSTVPMGVSDALLDAARDRPEAAIGMITQWSHAPATLLGGSPLPGLWLPQINRALMRRSGPGALHRDLLNCRDYTGGLAAAAKLKCPVLIVTGSRDLMTPPRSLDALLTALPQARLVSIEGAGHAMLGERPDAVLDALRNFVSD